MKRHTDGANHMYFDAHAKFMSRGQIMSDPCGEPWSGVELMRLLSDSGRCPLARPLPAIGSANSERWSGAGRPVALGPDDHPLLLIP